MNIVFQGDSATDSGRDRSCKSDLGEGYPHYAAAMIQDCFSESCDIEFFSIAEEGKSIRCLIDSFDDDLSDISPDILSLMIGVDDVLSQKTIDIEQYRCDIIDYIKLVKDRRGAAVMLIQPYIHSAIELTDSQMSVYKAIRKVVSDIQDEYADAYLPLPQSHLDESEGDIEENIILPDDASYTIGELYLEAISPIIENIIAQDK